jgi:hypothetical protein
MSNEKCAQYPRAYPFNFLKLCKIKLPTFGRYGIIAAPPHQNAACDTKPEPSLSAEEGRTCHTLCNILDSENFCPSKELANPHQNCNLAA